MKVFPDLPPRMRKLRCDPRGFPVPWFVAWVEDVPHFEAIGAGKLKEAVTGKCCWICGEPTGRYLAFVIGPMCAVNRVSSEPPSHLECARFAARNCPFLANPRMARLPEAKHIANPRAPAGRFIERNPGVALVWVTTRYQLFPVAGGHGAQPGVLFRIGEPTALEWYAEGRVATRAEILHSIETGAPALRAEAEAQDAAEPGAGARAAFATALTQALALVPVA